MIDALQVIKNWCASCGMPEPSNGECHALTVALAATPATVPVMLPEPAVAAPALEAPAARVDALRWGANVAETLLSIGESIGFGRAQQILGEQWEAKHDCAPRGRMGVTVKDAAALELSAEAVFEADKRMWLSGPTYAGLHDDDKQRCRAMARAALAATPAAAQVVLPEPVAAESRFTSLPGGDPWGWCTVEHAQAFCQDKNYEVRYLYTEQQVRTLLATGGHAQAKSANFKGEIYAAMGCGSDASEYAAIVGIKNLIRRENCLSAVEREFFMVETPPDEFEGDTTHGEECLLNWGQEPEQYAEQFGAALRLIAPQAQAVHAITGPCGQCKSSSQPCDCAISTILKERGLVAVDATHYSKVSAQAKAAAPQQADARDAKQLEAQADARDAKQLEAQADARDAAFEAVRQQFCKLQRYSFLLDSRCNMRRCADDCGNWVEFESVNTLFDPIAVDAAISAAKGE